jgi:hypothetical protein
MQAELWKKWPLKKSNGRKTDFTTFINKISFFLYFFISFFLSFFIYFCCPLFVFLPFINDKSSLRLVFDSILLQLCPSLKAITTKGRLVGFFVHKIALSSFPSFKF